MQGDRAQLAGALRRNWWPLALRGLAALLFGVLAFVWPGLTLLTMVFLFGVYALVDGVLTLLHATMVPRRFPRKGAETINGLASLVAGLLVFSWSQITWVVLLLIISGWAIATGLLEIATAMSLRRIIRSHWLSGLAGLVAFVFGFVILTQPSLGSTAVTRSIGGFAVVFGLLLLTVGLRVRRGAEYEPTAPAPAEA